MGIEVVLTRGYRGDTLEPTLMEQADSVEQILAVISAEQDGTVQYSGDRTQPCALVMFRHGGVDLQCELQRFAPIFEGHRWSTTASHCI